MEKEKSNKTIERTNWPQWIAGFGVLLLAFQIGSLSAWSSPYIVYLSSAESSISMTLNEISWMVNFLNVGRPIGAVVGAILNNYLGSKTAVFFSCMPVSLCWLFILIADRVEWLYAARFCGGVTIGMAYSCFSLYLGEIADPKNRGKLVALGTSGIPIGNVAMSAMGANLSMKTSAVIALSISLGLLVLFLCIHESPHHLIKKNRYEKAKASIRWYHRDLDVETEFVGLRKFVESVSNQSLSDFLKELRGSNFRKTMFIIVGLITYNQSCGVNSILFYMESILTMAKISVIRPSLVVTIVMAFGIVGAVLSMYFVDKFGKRILMIASCSGIAFSMCLLSVEFQLLHFGYDPSKVEALPIVAMCFFYAAVFFGALPVPSAMMGELFPPHLKCIAACLTSNVAGIVAFFSTSTYLPLLDLMTERYVFLFYGLLIATAVPFTTFCVPETKGMTLQEIQSQLTGEDKKRRISTCGDKEQQRRDQDTGPFVIS